MNRLKHTINIDTLRILYNSLLLSHINYCLSLWGHSSNRIFKLQKKALRIITLSKYNSHTEPLFKSLNLLKVKDLYELKILKTYYNFCHGLLPTYFQKIVMKNNELRSRTTRQSTQLHVPASNFTTVQQSIRYIIPKIVNSTSNDITEKINTHSIFGYSWFIKRKIIDNYNPICTNTNCFICHSAL